MASFPDRRLGTPRDLGRPGSRFFVVIPNLVMPYGSKSSRLAMPVNHHGNVAIGDLRCGDSMRRKKWTRLIIDGLSRRGSPIKIKRRSMIMIPEKPKKRKTP